MKRRLSIWYVRLRLFLGLLTEDEATWMLWNLR